MSRRLSLHPFRVRDSAGRSVRYMGTMTFGDRSSEHLNRALLESVLTRGRSSGPLRTLSSESESMLRRNGFRTGPETRLGSVLSAVFKLLLPLLGLVGIFAGLFLAAAIMETGIRWSTGIAVCACVLCIVVSASPLLLIQQVGFKAQLMSERLKVLRCAACNGETTRRVLEDHHTELRCVNCGARWIR